MRWRSDSADVVVSARAIAAKAVPASWSLSSTNSWCCENEKCNAITGGDDVEMRRASLTAKNLRSSNHDSLPLIELLTTKRDIDVKMAEGNDPVAVAGSAASALKSLDELRNQLDSLLEKYLHLLDQYDIAQKQLASFMSLVR